MVIPVSAAIDGGQNRNGGAFLRISWPWPLSAKRKWKRRRPIPRAAPIHWESHGWTLPLFHMETGASARRNGNPLPD